MMPALGRHIIAELYHCEVEKIDDVTFVEKAMLEAAELAGATVINSTFHHFSPFGVSGVIVIQESHFSIHCWPEYAYASIDIYTCGDSVNPWVAYEHLKKAFGASHGSTMELNRGQNNLLSTGKKSPEFHGEKQTIKKESIKSTRNIWFTQRNEDLALSLRHTGERLCMEKSPFQKIEVYDTNAMGRILVLDGKIVCAERDERAYHEMIAHVPLFVHPGPQRVLVIGGGDGGVCRELIRHEGLVHIDVVEIDEKVIEISKKYLPGLAAGFDDKRVHITIEDGFEFMKQTPANTFDIVIIDSELPGMDGSGSELYRHISRILKEDGILVAQGGSPRFDSEAFGRSFRGVSEVFGTAATHCYLLYLSSYPSGMWSFTLAPKNESLRPGAPDKLMVEEFCRKNQPEYYSYDVHKASFVLPSFVQRLLP